MVLLLLFWFLTTPILIYIYCVKKWPGCSLHFFHLCSTEGKKVTGVLGNMRVSTFYFKASNFVKKCLQFKLPFYSLQCHMILQIFRF